MEGNELGEIIQCIWGFFGMVKLFMQKNLFVVVLVVLEGNNLKEVTSVKQNFHSRGFFFTFEMNSFVQDDGTFHVEFSFWGGCSNVKTSKLSSQDANTVNV